MSVPLVGAGAATALRPAAALADSATAEAIQRQIDVAAQAGGGLVQLPAGTIPLEQPLMLRSNVQLAGSGAGTRLHQLGSAAITTPAGSGIRNAGLRDVAIHLLPSRDTGADRAGLLLRNVRWSQFANLFMTGFEQHTAIAVMPDRTNDEYESFVLNRIDNVVVEECTTGVRLQGLGTDKGKPVSVISNNVWSNITFRRVRRRGIEAVSWADSEKWFGCYMQANRRGCILMDFNPAGTWQQIDRFVIYAPTLVYAPNMDGRDVTAIRLGPGTMKIFVEGLLTDKIWRSNFVQDDGANSYRISFDSWGEGSGGKRRPRNHGPGIHQKGLSTGNHGLIQVPAGKRSVQVAHELRRPPEASELSITPMSNLAGISYWIAAIDNKVFTIEFSEPTRGPQRLAWRADVAEIGRGGVRPAVADAE